MALCITGTVYTLYQDGSGEIDPEEMEDIFRYAYLPDVRCLFRKPCQISKGVEKDQNEVTAKEKEKEWIKEDRKKEKEEKEEAELTKRKLLFGYSQPRYYSERMTR